jgi:RNA polymerase sigma-70 factor (ECF subfamily)
MSNAAVLLQRQLVYAPSVRRLASLSARRQELTRAGDAALVRALVANEPGGFQRLWQRFYPIVSRRLRRSLGASFEIDDLVQEVFLTLLGSIHRLRAPEALSAFVLGITRHAVSRELRRLSHVNMEVDPSEIHAIGVRDAASHHAFVHLEIVLGRLNERDRHAFTLRYVEGMSADEVAGALGVSVSTARRCFARAWKRVVYFADRNPFLSDYLERADPDRDD